MARERLMAVLEHEKILRVIEQAFLVDVAMVIVVEALVDRLDQAADDLLKGFEGTVDIGFGNRPVFGIYDDRAHGETSGSVVWGRTRGTLSFPAGFTPSRLTS